MKSGSRISPSTGIRLAVLLALGAIVCAASGESRISARAASDDGGLSASSRLRVELNVPRRLEFDARAFEGRIDTNGGTVLIGCLAGAQQACPNAGRAVGSHGANHQRLPAATSRSAVIAQP